MFHNNGAKQRCFAQRMPQAAAFLLWFALLFMARAASAQIVSTSVTPGSLPATGGTITVQAVLSASFPLNALNVYQNAGYIGSLNYVNTNPDGTKNYSKDFTVPANVTTQAQLYTYTLTAVDTASNMVNSAVGTVDVAAPAPISVVSASLGNTTLTAAGGNVAVNAKVKVVAPNTVYYIAVYGNGSNFGNLAYVSANGDGTLNYTGSFPIGTNVTNAPKPYLFSVLAYDNAGNRAPAIAGTLNVGNVTPVSLVSSSLSVTSLPATGGDVVLSATVNVPAPNDINYINARRIDTDLGNLGYVSANGASKVYSGAFSFPANNTDAPVTYPITLRVFDNAGNLASSLIGYVTVGATTPIKILSATLSANSVPTAGGNITVTATVLAPAPNDVSAVSVMNYDSNNTGLTYQSTNPDGSKVYSGAFVIPANTGNSHGLYNLIVRATDNAGNGATATPGTVAIDPVTPVKILSTSISTTTLPNTGGSVTISAVVNAPLPNGVNDVTVYRYDSNIGGLTYQSTNGDGSKNFSGTFAVPANATAASAVYFYTLVAHDTPNNIDKAYVGTVTLPPVTPITIVSATVSPATLLDAGGSVMVNAVVKAAAPNAVANVLVTTWGNNGVYLVYQSDNGDGTKNYSGTIPIGGIGGTVQELRQIGVTATDSAGYTAYRLAGYVTVGGTPSNAPVQIVSASLQNNNLSAVGGNVIVSAVIKQPAAGVFRYADVYLNNTYAGRLVYQSTNADGSFNYSLSIGIGGNTQNIPAVYEIRVATVQTDNSNVVASAGTVTVAAVTPVSLISKSLTGATAFPAAGGAFIVNATVSVPAPNAISGIYAYYGSGYLGNLTYVSTNADGTQNWAKSFTDGENTSGAIRPDLITILAIDRSGNAVPAVVGTITTAAQIPHSLVNATIATTNFPATGGTQIVMLTLNEPPDNYAPGQVYAYRNGVYIGNLTYFYTNIDGTQNWIGSYAVPANLSQLPRADTYYVVALDRAGNYVTTVIGTATVAGMAPIAIVSKTISATTFPAAGGDAQLTVTVTTPTPNYVYNMYAYRNGLYIGTFAYQNTNADGTQNFFLSANVPANINDAARTDTYYALAVDRTNAYYTTAQFPNVTSDPVTPISLTSATLNVTSVANVGGDVIIKATTKTPAPNSVAGGFYAYLNGSYAATMTFQNLNADGTANYSGTVPVPANITVFPQLYLFTLLAPDAAGNIATAILNPVTTDPVPATIAGRINFEGQVGSAPAQNVTFEFRPDDMSGNFTKTASVTANGFFSFTDIPRKNYSLRIKGPKNLAKAVQVNALNSDAHSVTTQLPGGDANNSDNVDLADFGFIVNAFGATNYDVNTGYDARADFTGDGAVDLADFGILINNFGSEGDL